MESHQNLNKMAWQRWESHLTGVFWANQLFRQREELLQGSMGRGLLMIAHSLLRYRNSLEDVQIFYTVLMLLKIQCHEIFNNNVFSDETNPFGHLSSRFDIFDLI